MTDEKKDPRVADAQLDASRTAKADLRDTCVAVVTYDAGGEVRCGRLMPCYRHPIDVLP